MCQALRELFADELKESREEGVSIGWKGGENSGIELAKKVFHLMNEKMPVSEIAKECKITEEKVKRILE